MDYAEALRYTHGFTDYEKKTGYSYSTESFDLRRPSALLALLGDPHLRFPSILVAGTKGKGSTCAMIASILQASGRKVALYTQPHLHTFRERIRVAGRLIAPTEMASAVGTVAQAVEELQRAAPQMGLPTTYEVATAAAMQFFAQQAPDIAVLEVGLGGRLDATNVVNPLVSVITPISLDHVQVLGNSISQIAAEKAGIIKENGVVVTSEQTDEAMAVIRRVADERGARLVVARPRTLGSDPVGRGTDQWSSPGPLEHAFPRFDRVRVTLLGPSGTTYGVEMPLLGSHQVANAATAIAVVEALGELGFPVDRAAVEKGLYQVSWPGRLEIVSRQPLVVVDGAHNGDSARKLAAAIADSFVYRHLVLVLGTSSDKDIKDIVAALAPMASAVIATRSSHARAADPEQLASESRIWCRRVEVTCDIPSAIELATSLAAPSDLICITGSLFTVADARAHYGLGANGD